MVKLHPYCTARLHQERKTTRSTNHHATGRQKKKLYCRSHSDITRFILISSLIFIRQPSMPPKRKAETDSAGSDGASDSNSESDFEAPRPAKSSKVAKKDTKAAKPKAKAATTKPKAAVTPRLKKAKTPSWTQVWQFLVSICSRPRFDPDASFL